MKIANIILAHKDSNQTVRLIKHLEQENIDCWLHWDKKAKEQELTEIVKNTNIQMVTPSLNIHWAGFNMVLAMINGLKCAVESGNQYDYYNFLSGQCYPIQDPTNMLTYLSLHDGAIFIGSRDIEESEENKQRINRYYLNDFNIQGKRWIEKMMTLCLPKRKIPLEFTVTKGPQWMTLPADAVDYILWFTRKNQSFLNFFKYVHCPDELFFQTILFNSPFRSRMREQVFHYTDWSEMKQSPKFLTLDDRFKIAENPLLFFARKFDMKKDAKILDYIDQMILSPKWNTSVF